MPGSPRRCKSFPNPRKSRERRGLYRSEMGFSETLQRRIKRLRSMKRDELVDRLRQQATARMDHVKYRLGRPVVGATALTAAPVQPQFFFSPESIPGMCALLKQRMPETAS